MGALIFPTSDLGRTLVGLLALGANACGAFVLPDGAHSDGGGLSAAGGATTTQAGSGGSGVTPGCVLPDADGDGVSASFAPACPASVLRGDCDDNDPSVHPGATEFTGDGIDQDCDSFDGDGIECGTAPWCPCDSTVSPNPVPNPCTGGDFAVAGVIECLVDGGCGTTVPATYAQVVNLGTEAARGQLAVSRGGGAVVAVVLLSLAAGQISPPVPVSGIDGATLIASATEPADCDPSNDRTEVPRPGLRLQCP